MSDDNTRDAAEPSLASAGSRRRPLYWLVQCADGDEIVCITREQADREVQSLEEFERPAVIVGLVPQPTLGDVELNAIRWAADTLCVGWDDLNPDDKDRSRKAADTLRRMVATLD